LVKRTGARAPLTIGPVIAACGFALLARPAIGGAYWTTFFPGICVLGLGMAVSVAPLTTTVMSAVPREAAGIASGINNAVSRTAGLIAVAVLGVILLQVFDRSFDARLAATPMTSVVRQAIAREQHKLTDAKLPQSMTRTAREAVERALEQAYVAGFRAVMLTSAAAALAAALVGWLTIGGLTRDQRARKSGTA
jgi:hypothetical protein